MLQKSFAAKILMTWRLEKNIFIFISILFFEIIIFLRKGFIKNAIRITVGRQVISSPGDTKQFIILTIAYEELSRC